MSAARTVVSHAEQQAIGMVVIAGTLAFVALCWAAAVCRDLRSHRRYARSADAAFDTVTVWHDDAGETDWDAELVELTGGEQR